MARDIEEFLRRAAERRKQAQQGRGGQKRPPARPQSTPPPPPPPRQTISERDVVKPRQERPARPLPSSKPKPAPVRKQESVKDHVARYIDTSDIAQHVEELGDEVEQADERMEAHLDDVFDHDVGRLSSQKKSPVSGAGKRNTNNLAKGIFQLLQNPVTVRQSIMVAEILKPPSFWDDE